MITVLPPTDFQINFGLGVIFGAIAGSFLATLALRWPAGRSIASGRSTCDHCGIRIAVRDLVPVLSFLALRGHCRSCWEKIDPLHPAMELLAALIGGIAFAFCPGWPGIAGAIFGWTLLVLAVLDLTYLWLPNAITATLLLSGLVAGAIGIYPTLQDRAIAAASGYLLLLIVATIYARVRGHQGMGGGDPKLLGAIGAWVGWQALPWVLLGASVAGLVGFFLLKATGRDLGRTSKIPLGFLLAIVAWPLWFWMSCS